MPRAKFVSIDQTSGVPVHVPRKTVRDVFIPAFRRVRSVRAPATDRARNLAWRACDWCLPWTLATYPGHSKGVLAILGRPVTWSLVGKWKSGTKPVPAWASRALAEWIDRRCEVGRALSAELREAAEEHDRREGLRLLHHPEQLQRGEFRRLPRVVSSEAD
jgi:hypothetical protein